METEWRGFELHPEVPPGGMTVDALFGRGRAEEFESYLTRFADSFGVPIAQPDLIPNTRRALAVTELARDRGLLEPFRNLVMAAHWADGLNIESDETLEALARRVGLDPEEALRAADAPEFQDRIDDTRREAHARGVTGIPTFYFGEIKTVGCRPYDDLANIARKSGFKEKSGKIIC